VSLHYVSETQDSVGFLLNKVFVLRIKFVMPHHGDRFRLVITMEPRFGL